ncbi:uncharacterized protein RHOBADRAFT_51196 [Rhodotorula graminis WP1]|uniref:histidine kinase n=1 Tax=Rhodotorula graminis (strain WP1) TaxID=578459 RepID=A0A194S9B1_RHOGW|nr:uncharacterized protein RHOBADRAFT_51196 [Rhodotorula graminis WP1]KPV77318.1 hypothetical protein RHOBADRAFT_51196 [Rhodotorula graminis WP1]
MHPGDGVASPTRLRPQGAAPAPAAHLASRLTHAFKHSTNGDDHPDESATSGGELLPHHLLAYLHDQPLAVAVFPHAPLLEQDEGLPAPVYQNPALLHFLGQGIGGAAVSNHPRAEEHARQQGLTLADAVDDRSRDLLRRFLRDGVERAADASPSAPPASAGAIPSPGGHHSGPLRVFQPSTSSASSASSSTSSVSHSSSSYNPRPGRPGSAGSGTSFSSTSRYSRFQPHRQIAFQLLSGLNFSKVHWRATVYVEYGCTLLTMLPASTVANGGQFTETTECDEESDDLIRFGEEASTGARAGSASAGDFVGNGGGDDDETVAGGGTRDEPYAPNGPEPSPTPSEARSEPERFPASVQHARHRLGKRTEGERIGDHEISHDGARDAVSLEGLAFTSWHAPVGLFRVNRDLSITQANPKWRQTCGLTEGETNDAWPARIHPDDRERVVDHYRRISEELPIERDEQEFRWLPTSGSRERWCVCVIEPAIVNGVMNGYCGYLLNINKHKLAATASELREEQLRHELALLSETTSVGLVRIDLDGHFLSANEAWYGICRVERGSPLDVWSDNLHPDDFDWVFKQWKHSLDTREPFQARFRWKFGDVCLVQAVLNNRDAASATGWIGSVTDVTAQARSEEKLLALSKEREERAEHYAREAEERRKIAVEEKKQQELLIDVTSHEIRNPISAILQNADFTRSSLQSFRGRLGQLKERGALPAELDDELLHDLDEDIEALDAISECGMAQERIANDILGLAQIQLSKYSITPVVFDLTTSLRNICRMFKTECRAKSIELQLVVGSSLARLGPRAKVFADPTRLTQVLVNLLSNAIRFTAKSDKRVVTITVEVSAQPPGRDSPLIPPAETEYKIDKQKPVYLFFSVEDTGPGMTEEETGRLFAKFMQASPFTHTTWGGSGLGLWIARNLCELQMGRIEVASTVGQGSIFRCFITARSVDAGPSHSSDVLPVVDGIDAPNAERGRAPTIFLAKPDESLPLKGMTILCCEDNQINRTVLKRQLAKQGCEHILLACDGQEGLEILKKQPDGKVDCILMDIEMPIMDGLQATRAIRLAEQQGERSGHQRIVGLTGNARVEQKQAALDAGMETVVTKPYKVPDLVARILQDAPDIEPTAPKQASSAGAGLSSSFVPSGDHGEVITKLSTGATVEIITPGSPAPSSSSSLRAGASDDRSLPPGSHEMIMGRSTEGDGGGEVMIDKDSVDRAASSMQRHGEGRALPPSQTEPRSLEK